MVKKFRHQLNLANFNYAGNVNEFLENLAEHIRSR